METKKHAHADLSKKRHTFLLAGFVFATACTLASFEFRTEREPIAHDDWEIPMEVVEVDYMPISVIPEKKSEKIELPKVQKKSPIIDIVPDHVDIPEDYSLNDLPPIEDIPEAKPTEAPVPPTVNYAEVMPVFMAGEKDLFLYLADHVNYPIPAIEAHIQGVVYVSFVVNEHGKVTNVELLKGIGGGCDEEALRVIEQMPNWHPGLQGGMPVRVKFTLPVKFILK